MLHPHDLIFDERTCLIFDERTYSIFVERTWLQFLLIIRAVGKGERATQVEQ
jgi:hypothetical protein